METENVFLQIPSCTTHVQPWLFCSPPVGCGEKNRPDAVDTGWPVRDKQQKPPQPPWCSPLMMKRNVSAMICGKNAIPSGACCFSWSIHNICQKPMDAENRWLSIWESSIHCSTPAPLKSSFQAHFLFKWKHVDDFIKEWISRKKIKRSQKTPNN